MRTMEFFGQLIDTAPVCVSYVMKLNVDSKSNFAVVAGYKVD